MPAFGRWAALIEPTPGYLSTACRASEAHLGRLLLLYNISSSGCSSFLCIYEFHFAKLARRRVG